MTLEEIEDAIQRGHVGDTKLLGDCLLALVEIVKEQQRLIRNHAFEIQRGQGETGGFFFPGRRPL